MKITPTRALLGTVTLFFVGCAAPEVKNLSSPSTSSDVIIPVTKADAQILRRASEILSDELKWNRNDNRECAHDAVKFSLYCALFKASIEINSVFDHRLAALEEVRRTVEVESKGKTYEHRLMGYNNDATTRFADIKNVLVKTKKRIEERMRMQRGL